jgi:hypothetical protein
MNRDEDDDDERDEAGDVSPVRYRVIARARIRNAAMPQNNTEQGPSWLKDVPLPRSLAAQVGGNLNTAAAADQWMNVALGAFMGDKSGWNRASNCQLNSTADEHPKYRWDLKLSRLLPPLADLDNPSLTPNKYKKAKRLLDNLWKWMEGSNAVNAQLLALMGDDWFIASDGDLLRAFQAALSAGAGVVGAAAPPPPPGGAGGPGGAIAALAAPPAPIMAALAAPLPAPFQPLTCARGKSELLHMAVRCNTAAEMFLSTPLLQILSQPQQPLTCDPNMDWLAERWYVYPVVRGARKLLTIRNDEGDDVNVGEEFVFTFFRNTHLQGGAAALAQRRGAAPLRRVREILPEELEQEAPAGEEEEKGEEQGVEEEKAGEEELGADIGGLGVGMEGEEDVAAAAAPVGMSSRVQQYLRRLKQESKDQFRTNPPALRVRTAGMDDFPEDPNDLTRLCTESSVYSIIKSLNKNQLRELWRENSTYFFQKQGLTLLWFTRPAAAVVTSTFDFDACYLTFLCTPRLIETMDKKGLKKLSARMGTEFDKTDLGVSRVRILEKVLQTHFNVPNIQPDMDVAQEYNAQVQRAVFKSRDKMHTFFRFVVREKDIKKDVGGQWGELAHDLTRALEQPTNILQLWFLCSHIDNPALKPQWLNMLLSMFAKSGILYLLVCEEPSGTAKISYSRAEKAYTADGFRFLHFAPLMLQAKDTRLIDGVLTVNGDDWRDVYTYYATDLNSAIQRSRVVPRPVTVPRAGRMYPPS